MGTGRHGARYPSPVTTPAPPYPRPFGPYVLLERLGQGGMSEVDLATRAVDDADYVRFVVIKRIHTQHTGEESFVRMFQDEARINAELQHENIATVYDFGLQGSEFFLAMEYVPGCDLRRIQRQLVRRGQHFPIRIALRIISDVLAALDYAHHRVDTYGRSMNIVHRDVNPRNIMLSVRGEVKLIDFGVAKADNRADQTVGHSIKGKFAYMAPEQIEARGPVDGRADLFAVGIVLYELLSNQSPFAGLSEVQTMHRILGGQIPAITSTDKHPIPDEVLDLLDRALATNRDQRFRDATQMREAVLRAVAAVGGLPGRVEMAEFVRQVDPETSGVSARLEEWRQGGLPRLLSTPAPVIGPSTQSRSLQQGGTGVVSAPLSLQPGQSGSFTGSVVAPPPPSRLLPALGLGLGLGAMLLLGLGIGWLFNRAPSPSPTPSPTPDPPAIAQPLEAPPPSPGSTEPSPTEPSPPAPVVETAPPPATVTSAPKGTDRAAGSPPPEPPPPEPEPQPLPPEPEPEPDLRAPEPPPPEPEPPPPEPEPEPVVSVPSTPASTGSSSQGGPTGFLNISSRPTGLELSVDGRSYGRTPVRALELPVGSRTLVVRDPATGQSWQKQVRVEEGRAQVIVLGEGT